MKLLPAQNCVSVSYLYTSWFPIVYCGTIVLMAYLFFRFEKQHFYIFQWVLKIDCTRINTKVKMFLLDVQYSRASLELEPKLDLHTE
jgi:hypothetical protein